jgi:hypothetical protein
MFNSRAMQIESDYKRQEMLRRAEQRRLIRETKQAAPRAAKNLLALIALLTAIRLA